MIEKDIFKKSLPDHDKLLEYGFSCVDSKYSLKKKILGSFEIRVCIENDNVLGSIYDLEMEDEYLGFRIEDNIGEFAGNIRNEFIKLLTDIRDKCFISEYFVGSQANRISNMIISKFGDYPSFEWDNYPDFGVFKNNDSKKWYALIMNINRNKIDTGNEMVDVLNVKIDPDKIIKLLEKKYYYKAYHMNKKNWISIILDDSLSDEEVFSLIKESYSYTVKNSNPGEWIVPANPKYYDIESAFKHNKIINWKQSSDVKIGDIVYIYVGSPVSALLYKCKVLKNNIPYSYSDSNVKMKYIMKIELLEEYSKELFPFSILKEYGVRAVRGPRYITHELVDYINKRTR